MGRKYVIFCIANSEQHLKSRTTFISTSCNKSSEIKNVLSGSVVCVCVGFGDFFGGFWLVGLWFFAEVLNS